MMKYVYTFVWLVYLFANSIIGIIAQESEQKIMGQSWEEIKKNPNKQGLLTVFHYDRRPFFYENEMGGSGGIEHDVASELSRYIQGKYDIHIFLQLKKFNDYQSFHEAMKNNTHPGVIGLSSVRIDQENTTGVKFSKPFMTGIEVVITSSNLPIAQAKGQMKEILNGKTAVTVKGSPFETHLLQFMPEHYPDAKIIYVEKSEQIAEKVAQNPDLFAFAPLPDYYTQLKLGKSLGRQPYFSLPHEGYALTLPLKTDWDTVVEEFFADQGFKPIMNFVIKRHLGTDVKDLLWEDKKNDISNEEYGEELDPVSLKVALDEEKLKNQTMFIITIVVVGILLVMIFLGRKYRKQKNTLIGQQSEQIQAQKSKIKQTEDKYDHAYHYAGYIQEITLKKRDRLSQIYTESFVWFAAREELSGDFYWTAKTEVGKVIIVIDTTGQNVAGALASVQLNIILSQIVKEDKITAPDKILAEIDHYLNNITTHAGADFLHKDGLTISIALIDTKNKLNYAGAGQPMYYVSDFKLHQFKPKKTAVGLPAFKVGEIVLYEAQLQKGDMVYLCTDGFQGQLGSDNKHKYMVKRFREFLFEISDLAPSVQLDKLKKEFEYWKKNRKQTDDITIMGFRI